MLSKHFLRVYHADTDCMGVVHHATYLKFFEQGRAELLREMGIELESLLPKYQVQFGIHSIQIDYLKPARLDETLCVVSELVSSKPASLVYHQHIVLDSKPRTSSEVKFSETDSSTGSSDSLLCRAVIRLVCLDAAFQPRKVPEVLVREILKK